MMQTPAIAMLFLLFGFHIPVQKDEPGKQHEVIPHPSRLFAPDKQTEQLLSVYSRYTVLFQTEGMQGLKELISPDFTFGYGKEVLHGHKALQTWDGVFTGLSIHEVSVRFANPIFNHSKAIAQIEQTITFEPDRSHPLFRTSSMTWNWKQTWSRTADGWKLTNMIRTSDQEERAKEKSPLLAYTFTSPAHSKQADEKKQTGTKAESPSTEGKPEARMQALYDLAPDKQTKQFLPACVRYTTLVQTKGAQGLNQIIGTGFAVHFGTEWFRGQKGIAELAKYMSGLETGEVAVKIQQLTFWQNKAVALTKETMRYRFDTPGKPPIWASGDHYWKQTWQKTAQGWRLVLIEPGAKNVKEDSPTFTFTAHANAAGQEEEKLLVQTLSK